MRISDWSSDVCSSDLLRQALALCAGSRFTALMAGLGVAALLQSSTATALLVSSFAGRGLLTTAPALSVMLGADIGSTLAAQLLSLQAGALSPALIALGVVLLLSVAVGRRRPPRWVLSVLGLLMRAVALALEALRPPPTAAGLAAPFAGRGLLTTAPALSVMLGADIGSTLAAQLLSLQAGALSPALIALGVVLFLSVAGGRRRHLGRVLIGLGLLLLAVGLIVEASRPLQQADGLAAALAA